MNVVPLDFKKPGPLAGAQERQCVSWLSAACALATRIWGERLPQPLELAVKGHDVHQPSHVLARLGEESVAYRLDLADNLHSLLVWPRPLALAVVSLLLSEPAQTLPADRELTLVEESLLEFFLKDFLLPPFLETWIGTEPLRLALGAQEPHPRWSRLFAADEPLFVASFTLPGPLAAAPWQWLIPRAGLYKKWGWTEAPREDAAALQARLHSLVRDLPVQVTIRLGAAELSLAQLAQLQVGDVIILDQAIDQPLCGNIGKEKKLKGWPGRKGTRQAIQIESIEG